jgi:hypothetical protein
MLLIWVTVENVLNLFIRLACSGKNGRKPRCTNAGSKKLPKKKLPNPRRMKKKSLKNGFTANLGLKKKSVAKKGRWKKTGANSSPRLANGKSQKPLPKT